MANRKRVKRYYQVARNGAQDLDTPVMRELIQEAGGKKKILDLGCGDGTRLSIIGKRKIAVGVDESDFAIKEGRKRYPRLKLIKGDISKLPFNAGKFDLVYSAFVLEHLDEPEEVLNEAIRVLKKNGVLFLAAPNFGAPNRRSPCSEENKYLKLFRGLIKDFFWRNSQKLSWKEVRPRTDEPYQIDFDTRIEPYVLSLIYFLKRRGLVIVKSPTFWEIQEKNKSFLFRIIRALGKKRIFPFKFWGPQLLVVAQKK
jgi:ubiquinone/menaquinone biosynthesis C-methylase UbiE